MKTNMGTLDRIIRIVVAVVFTILFITQTVTGAAGIAMILAGGIFMATSFLGFCPLYTLFGINSCRKAN